MISDAEGKGIAPARLAKVNELKLKHGQKKELEMAKILLADPELKTCLLSGPLEQNGHVVTVVDEEHHLYRAIKSFNPDVVVTNYLADMKAVNELCRAMDGHHTKKPTLVISTQDKHWAVFLFDAVAGYFNISPMPGNLADVLTSVIDRVQTRGEC